MNCLGVLDHFVGLAVNGLKSQKFVISTFKSMFLIETQDNEGSLEKWYIGVQNFLLVSIVLKESLTDKNYSSEIKLEQN